VTDGLFHIAGDGTLAAMAVAPFDAEAVLQELLVSHPDLLAGGQMNPGAPRRWALVRREQGVPDREGPGYRFSVDHLFVDQDAVPTLVEVKRSTDTRIRREVVGQMLDYAANGVRYWPVDDLRAAFQTSQQALGHDPAEAIAALCGDPDMTVDSFFLRVADNLRAGRVRMVFVADVIPDELRRITEFLNEQMSPAEVFAVEVRQFRAPGYDGMVIVPAVYGRTAATSVKDARSSKTAREEQLAASKPSTHAALKLCEELARDLGLVARVSAGGLIIQTSSNRTVAAVYLAPWDSIEVPLKQLRDAGRDGVADEIGTRLQRMTPKPLTGRHPQFPTGDAIGDNWPEVRSILELMARTQQGRD
jgi:hypothetical protein